MSEYNIRSVLCDGESEVIRQDDSALVPGTLLPSGFFVLECGKRELEEETGMTAKQYENLGDFYPSVGYVDEVIYCYLATGLTSTQQHLDEDEFLDVELIPLKTLYHKVSDKCCYNVLV